MSFGKNLQYLRQLSANMTQEALAEKLNVSRQTIIVRLDIPGECLDMYSEKKSVQS